MSAAGVDRRARRRRSSSDDYDFIVANFANPDMVGHTGVWDATVAALGDDRRLPRPGRRRARGVGRAPTRRARARCSSITADHGNADELRDAEGQPVTAHSLNPVPFVARRAGGRRAPRSHDGVLADVAPTLLELAGLPRWDGMTGRSLLDPIEAGRSDA